MKDLSVFVPNVLIECEGCSDLVAKSFIKNIIQDFCVSTNAYTAQLDTVYIFDGVTNYTLDAPNNTVIVAILEVKKNGVNFENYTYDHVDFILGSAPTEDFTLDVKVALKPTIAATQVDDRFYDIYFDAITTGVKARLMLQPSKPWSNPDLGMKYQSDYEKAINKVRIALGKSVSKNRNLSAQMRQWL